MSKRDARQGRGPLRRVLRGDAGFAYTYEIEQPPSLLYLAAVSGAGTAIVVPELVVLHAGAPEESVAYNCLSLGRELDKKGKVRPSGELATLLRKANDDFLRVSDPDHASLSLVETAMAENIVEILGMIDARAERPLLDVMLVGAAGYVLPRSDHPKMLAFVNESLPRTRQLDMAELASASLAPEGDGLLKQQTSLGGKVEWLPYMGLLLLSHASRNDLDALSIREDEPDMLSVGFWEITREFHGWLGDAAPPAEPAKRFARALSARFAGRDAEARRILTACKDAGDPRAERYLALKR